MSKDQEKIDQFFKLEEEIWKLVGCDGDFYPGLVDARHHSFYLDNNEILYGTPGTDECWGGDIYGKAIFRGKNYTIAVYDNGCGDSCCPVLLDNTKAVDQDEFLLHDN